MDMDMDMAETVREVIMLLSVFNRSCESLLALCVSSHGNGFRLKIKRRADVRR